MISWAQLVNVILSVEQINSLRFPVMVMGWLLVGVWARTVADRPERSGAIGLCVALLVSPNSHPYDAILLLPALPLIRWSEIQAGGLVLMAWLASIPLQQRGLWTISIVVILLVSMLHVRSEEDRPVS